MLCYGRMALAIEDVSARVEAISESLKANRAEIDALFKSIRESTAIVEQFNQTAAETIKVDIDSRSGAMLISLSPQMQRIIDQNAKILSIASKICVDDLLPLYRADVERFDRAARSAIELVKDYVAREDALLSALDSVRDTDSSIVEARERSRKAYAENVGRTYNTKAEFLKRFGLK